ncbi:MAG: hypothetical protein QG579_331 [Patescibacteria group bacterium]|jgi:hypothetical protein|nr:hypothetical protein [Patescibacteria group bacterium]
MLEKLPSQEELNSFQEEAEEIDKKAEKLVESGESKSMQEATDLIIKTKEGKEGVGQKARMINIYKFTESQYISGNFISTPGLLFDDCVYESVLDYAKIEIVPFLEDGKDLIHNLTSKDFETLLQSIDNPRVFTLLIALAEKMKIPRDEIEKFYGIIEQSAKKELLFEVTSGKSSSFGGIRENIFSPSQFDPRKDTLKYVDDEIKQRILEIAEKYDSSLTNEDSEAYRIKMEVQTNPEKFILDCIRQTPIYNAIKFIAALKSFIEKNRDRVNKEVIIQAIQDLDEKKYGDKPEMVKVITGVFQ